MVIEEEEGIKRSGAFKFKREKKEKKNLSS